MPGIGLPIVIPHTIRVDVRFSTNSLVGLQDLTNKMRNLWPWQWTGLPEFLLQIKSDLDLFSCLPCAVFASVAERGGETHRPRPKTRSRRARSLTRSTRGSPSTRHGGVHRRSPLICHVLRRWEWEDQEEQRNQGDPPRTAINKSMMQLPLRSICLCSAVHSWMGFLVLRLRNRSDEGGEGRMPLPFQLRRRRIWREPRGKRGGRGERSLCCIVAIRM